METRINAPNILIVDDEIGPRESLRMILKPYYNIFTAESGYAAIQMVQQVGLHVVTLDSFGTSAAMLGNIGPGLGTLGPFSNYSAVPYAGKWFMAFLMLLGRLELMSVLILFSKSFYRK